MNGFLGFWIEKNVLKKGKFVSCVAVVALTCMLAVTILIISESMMAGMVDRIVNLSSGHVTVREIENIDEFERQLLQYENGQNIKNVLYTTGGYAMLYSQNTSVSVLIKGINADFFAQRAGYIKIKNADNVNVNVAPPQSDFFTADATDVSAATQNKSDFVATDAMPLKSNFVISNFDATSNNIQRCVFIGADTAEKLQVVTGDKIALLIIPDSSSKTVRPDVCTVAGIFETGYSEIDEKIAFAPNNYAKTLYPAKESSSVEILLNNSNYNEISALKKFLKNYKTYDWMQLNGDIYLNFVSSRQAIELLLVLIIVVTAYYTVSATQQIIQDENRSIAIYRLLGTSVHKIFTSLVLSVLSVVVLSLIIGSILGLLLGLSSPKLFSFFATHFGGLKYYLFDFSVKIPWTLVLILLCMFVGVSLLFVVIAVFGIRKIKPMRLFNK